MHSIADGVRVGVSKFLIAPLYEGEYSPEIIGTVIALAKVLQHGVETRRQQKRTGHTEPVPERTVAMTKQKSMMIMAMAFSTLLLAGCPASLSDVTKAAYTFVDDNGDGVCDTCGQGADGNGDGVCDNFVDADGDGTCDNRQSHALLGQGSLGYSFQDGAGDGVCDMCGGQDANGDGVCDNFVDADGDGLCDNRQSHALLGQGSTGYRLQDGDGDGICEMCGGQDANGDGVCDNFADEDGDGICDNRQSHALLGQGSLGYSFQDGAGDGVCDMCGGQDANGDGVCDSFVDADGDGLCDNQNSHLQQGTDSGRGGNGGGGQNT